MKFTVLRGLLLTALVLAVNAASTAIAEGQATMHVVHPRCEYLQNPLGIDVARPRLSWELQSDRRAEKQSAYQILVSSTPEKLATDAGDLWDSGKVASDETAQIEYAGQSLASRGACYWKVRVWDRDGRPSGWSEVAHWEMGLLQRADWQATWIDAAPPTAASRGFHVLKALYESQDGKAAKDVTALLQAREGKVPYEVSVTNESLGGDPLPGVVKQLRVTYELDGAPHDQTVPEFGNFHVEAEIPYLRKSFSIDRPVRSARLYATSLGLYEIRLNGQRVGDHVFAPDWTDYGKRIRYQVYDVTRQLRAGENVIGGMVANGWYSGHLGNWAYQFWGKQPALLCQLEITRDDGSVQRIVSDTSWKRHDGPIQLSDIMLGERYDATAEIAGWDRPGMQDDEWTAVTRRDPPSAVLEGQVAEPVRALREMKPIKLSQPQPGHWIFDLGQNMVGVVRLSVSGQKGQTVTIRHGEMLNPDGTLYTANLRGAPCVDTYTFGGDGDVTWQPRFTYHGFRYVELTGLSQPPSLDSITGVVIGSDTPAAGEFFCSDPRINQLQSNIQWGQRGNFFSVPTDCPQRNERLGWMGDAQVFIRTAIWNADVAAFFNKWFVDVDDARAPDGRFSSFSPRTVPITTDFGAVPGWADAGTICPWTIYQAYGDRRVLEQHYPAMVQWVEWCRQHSTGLIRDKDRGHDYGDWLAIGADTPKDLIGTAYFGYSTHLLSKIAAVIGKADDAAKYQQLFEQIRAAFVKTYVAPDGKIKGNTQTDYAMALAFDLVPNEMREAVAEHLDEAIEAKNDHVSTGFVGVSYLLPTLSRAGKTPTAYKLLLQDTFPSWLFSVKNGATTIWERWDGWTPDKGFQNPGMNSFNHYSLGSCGQWLFETVGGINPDPDQPGFRHVVIHPQPGGGLTWADARYASIRGKIESKWAIEGNDLLVDVSIPANTTATVLLPAADGPTTEGGRAVEQAEGVSSAMKQGGLIKIEIGSGSYRFRTPLVH